MYWFQLARELHLVAVQNFALVVLKWLQIRYFNGQHQWRNVDYRVADIIKKYNKYEIVLKHRQDLRMKKPNNRIKNQKNSKREHRESNCFPLCCAFVSFRFNPQRAREQTYLSQIGLFTVWWVFVVVLSSPVVFPDMRSKVVQIQMQTER